MDVRLVTLGTPRVHLGEEELTSLPGKPVSFGVLVYLAQDIPLVLHEAEEVK